MNAAGWRIYLVTSGNKPGGGSLGSDLWRVPGGKVGLIEGVDSIPSAGLAFSANRVCREGHFITLRVLEDWRGSEFLSLRDRKWSPFSEHSRIHISVWRQRRKMLEILLRSLNSQLGHQPSYVFCSFCALDQGSPTPQAMDWYWSLAC